MKKIIYSDRWGQILEITRYRDTRPGKRGRFVAAKSVKRLKKHPPNEEIQQYRYAQGERYEPINITRPSIQIKSTYPGSVIDYQGNIWEMIRDTNIFTQISKASRALINVRGYGPDGREIKMQGEVELGERHQAEQLTMAAKELLASYGYRTQYNLELIRMSGKARREALRMNELEDTQFTITIMR